MRRRMPPPAARPPTTVGSLLRESRQLGASLSWHTWREVVGPNVAKRSCPRNEENGTLFVTVTSPAWAQELSLLSRSILEGLAAHGCGAHSLRFVVGPVELPARAPVTKRVERQALPAGLSERLDALEDPRLRELIEEAASYRRS